MATTSQSFPRLPADADLGAPVHVRERVVPLGEIVPVGRANSTLDLVGNTPLLELKRLTAGLIPAGRADFRQARGLQPRRLGQGSAGEKNDRGRNRRRQVEARQGDSRFDLGQHRNRAGDDRRHARLSGRAGDAVEREPRAQENRRGLRREDSLLRSDGRLRRRDPAVPQAARRRIPRATSSPTSTTTRPTRSRISKPPGRKSGVRPAAR